MLPFFYKNNFPTLRSCVADSLPFLEDQEAFGLWAFGPEYELLHGMNKFMDAWNERHFDKLILNGSGEVAQDIKKMVDIWKRETCYN